ncbi:MAG: response regulator, partial [Gammaproteobacteria bacterium]|nr:response regulator [Gammaproteobacteria bacterium]
GQQAVEMAGEFDYDLILMDIQMPVMDGLTAAAHIRRIPGRGTLPMLALTANAFEADREASRRAGLNEHLAKPIVPAALYGALLRWLPSEPRRAAPVSAPTVAAGQPQTGDQTSELIARLAAIEGLDTAQGLEYLGQQTDVYLRVLRIFAGRCADDMDALRAALDGGAAADARRIAHSIKGNAAILGATQVQPLAAQLEAAIKAGKDVAELAELTDRVEVVYGALAEALSRVLGARE